MSQPQRDAARSRRIAIFLAAAGSAAIVIAVVLLVTAPHPASFGWFAYTPLSDVSFSPSGMLLSTQAGIGLTVGILGVAVLAFCGGWAFGARRRR